LKWTAALIVAAGGVVACAAVLGIDDGHPRDQGAGATDGLAPGAVLGDGGIVSTNGQQCEDVTADDAAGVYVTAGSGADGDSCGTRAQPCKTISEGILRAQSLSRPGVYVGEGTYAEAIQMAAGVTIIGGWTVLAGTGDPTWQRACSTSVTTILAPDANAIATVRAESITGSAKLSTLTVKTFATAAPGESMIGILAAGGTTLDLVAVDIVATAGGAGTDGNAGDAGSPGEADCDAGSDGAPGSDQASQASGADSGYFGPTGYVPLTGDPGPTGPTGENGAAGTASTCVDCRSCGGGALGCTDLDAGVSCGTPGAVGCGGGGGAGGGGGGGGGSSIAIVAWDNAHVNVTGGSLTSSDGGKGGAGAQGGTGAGGGSGAAGTGTATCSTKCAGGLGVTNCVSTTGAAAGGGAGGMGGHGGAGGQGGDGAGGDSFAYVAGGGATVVVDSKATALTHGNAGKTAGNGADGHAADKGP
jgi:hypothetical protein